MTNPLQSELLKAASSTFETLGFLSPDPEIHEWQQGAPMACGAVVDFRGPVHGTLRVRVTGDVATELAANMLGLFDGGDTSMQGDAVGEVANVICGNVVPFLGRPEDVFDLSSPRKEGPQDVAASEDDAPEGSVRVEFGVEEGRAEVLLVLGEGATP